ncbi:fungal specific transcription factor [Colletotrichum musicola]|uniref:Fungal specific transcription factor n=1 Tax=Colletotrichum musicola TaxID=2175873 RepID=A0A8H6NBQ2_9PEZI|nr:fungal specific transcription factor [Colletotrichum musicola]
MGEFAATEGIEPYDSYSRMEPFSPTEAAIDRDLRLRIRDFYRTSDNKDLNDRWLEFFTPGARVKVGALEAEKHESLRQLRAAMWSSVLGRKHWVTRAIGSVDKQGVHVMLKGGVTRKGLDGGESTFSWAGSAAWKKYDGEWRMDDYRVWLDQWTSMDGPMPSESES